jgi:hypothetical protein
MHVVAMVCSRHGCTAAAVGPGAACLQPRSQGMQMQESGELEAAACAGACGVRMITRRVMGSGARATAGLAAPASEWVATGEVQRSRNVNADRRTALAALTMRVAMVVHSTTAAWLTAATAAAARAAEAVAEEELEEDIGFKGLGVFGL